MATLRTTAKPLNRRPAIQGRWLLMIGLCFVILIVGGGLALRVLRSSVPAQIVPGQTLAWDIARTVGRTTGVQLASGAYLPGDTLLLYSRLDLPDRASVRTWAQTQLEPFVARFAQLSPGETLKWVIDFGAASAEQEVIIAPLNRAADSTLYRYISAAPALFTVVNAQPTEAAKPLNSAPTTQAAVTPNNLPLVAPAVTVQPGTTVQPATTGVTATAPGPATALHNFQFDNAAHVNQEWLPLSGDWAVSAGIYSQRNQKGYDFISMLKLEPQTHYSLETRLRRVKGEMGGGLIYNAPNQGARAGAQVIDMDKQGSFLRWGRYDANGQYIYEGGMPLTPPLNDGQWHALQLITHAGASIVALDGRQLVKLTNTSLGGYLGLMTSNAAVDFDNVHVSALPPLDAALITLPVTATLTSTATNAISQTIASSANFNDDFADGNANGWRVLNGTWQVIEQEYQQTGTDGFDLGSVSAFQGEVYTVSVRLRRIDGSMGGGLYFNMAQRDAKMDSQMINYTRNGKAIQWGHFDEGGNFVFEGSAPVADGGDGKWHTLTAVVQTGKVAFTLDDQLIAKDIALTYSSGYVGLLTSTSKVAFDDVKIVTQ
ncbi:hypothetical protein BH10CHL1_BH10CHL1_40030 [soil metagenome]